MTEKLLMQLQAGLVTVDGAGLQFTRQPTIEEWQKLHFFLLSCRRASLRWIADSRKVGREQFGEDVVTSTEEQLMLDLNDDRAATALEKLPEKIEGLTDSHLVTLTRRTRDAKEFRKWLQIAREQRLTAQELAKSIKLGRVCKVGENPDDAPINPQDKSVGIVTIEGISTSFGMWLRKVVQDGFPHAWDFNRLSRIRTFLAPFVEANKAAEEAQRKQSANMIGR